MLKQYFFEAGSFPDLSYAELLCVFETFGLSKDIVHKYTEKFFLIKSKDIDQEVLATIFSRLGGFLRFGIVVDDIDTFLDPYLKENKKITFGISSIGSSSSISLKKLGNTIKTTLKEYGISSRFVAPRRGDYALNTAQILHNDILKKGFELCIVGNQKEEIYCKTLAIQDMEGFVRMDMGKPYSDIEMGVLPPKLARIMVNLTGLTEGVLWDPFCGSGTILMESALLGFNFLGSDIDSNAVHDTEENIRWLDSEGLIDNVEYEAFQLDIAQPDHTVVKKLKNTDISAIVCEPYMGPPQKREISVEKANGLLKDVKSLYLSLFDLIDNKITKRGIKVVLIIPSYKTTKGWRTFGIRDLVSKRWELLNGEYSGGRDLKWSRKNSIITRNIFILRRT